MLYRIRLFSLSDLCAATKTNNSKRALWFLILKILHTISKKSSLNRVYRWSSLRWKALFKIDNENELFFAFFLLHRYALQTTKSDFLYQICALQQKQQKELCLIQILHTIWKKSSLNREIPLCAEKLFVLKRILKTWILQEELRENPLEELTESSV